MFNVTAVHVITCTPSDAREIAVLVRFGKPCIYFTHNLKVTSGICKSVDDKHVQSSHPYNARGIHTLLKSLSVVSGHVFEGFMPAPTIEKNVFRSLKVAFTVLFICLKLVNSMTPTCLCSSSSSKDSLPSFQSRDLLSLLCSDGDSPNTNVTV